MMKNDEESLENNSQMVKTFVRFGKDCEFEHSIGQLLIVPFPSSREIHEHRPNVTEWLEQMKKFRECCKSSNYKRNASCSVNRLVSIHPIPLK